MGFRCFDTHALAPLPLEFSHSHSHSLTSPSPSKCKTTTLVRSHACAPLPLASSSHPRSEPECAHTLLNILTTLSLSARLGYLNTYAVNDILGASRVIYGLPSMLTCLSYLQMREHKAIVSSSLNAIRRGASPHPLIVASPLALAPNMSGSGSGSQLARAHLRSGALVGATRSCV
jgi:hypothetical protein